MSLGSGPKRNSFAAAAATVARPQLRVCRPVSHKGPRGEPIGRLSDRNRLGFHCQGGVIAVAVAVVGIGIGIVPNAGDGLHSHGPCGCVSPKNPPVGDFGAPPRVAVPRSPNHPLREDGIGGRVAHRRIVVVVVIVIRGTSSSSTVRVRVRVRVIGCHNDRHAEGPNPKECPAGKEPVGTSLGVVGRIGGKEERLDAIAAAVRYGMDLVKGHCRVVGTLLGLALAVKEPEHVHRSVLFGARVPALLDDVQELVL